MFYRMTSEQKIVWDAIFRFSLHLSRSLVTLDLWSYQIWLLRRNIGAKRVKSENIDQGYREAMFDRRCLFSCSDISYHWLGLHQWQTMARIWREERNTVHAQVNCITTIVKTNGRLGYVFITDVLDKLSNGLSRANLIGISQMDRLL